MGIMCSVQLRDVIKKKKLSSKMVNAIRLPLYKLLRTSFQTKMLCSDTLVKYFITVQTARRKYVTCDFQNIWYVVALNARENRFFFTHFSRSVSAFSILKIANFDLPPPLSEYILHEWSLTYKMFREAIYNWIVSPGTCV